MSEIAINFCIAKFLLIQTLLHVLNDKIALKNKPRWRSGSASHLYKLTQLTNEKVTRSIRVRGIFLSHFQQLFFGFVFCFVFDCIQFSFIAFVYNPSNTSLYISNCTPLTFFSFLLNFVKVLFRTSNSRLSQT